MGNEISQFANEKVSKLLLKFAIPVILSFLVTELYNMADVFFVGNFGSSYAVGGITVIFPIQKLLVAISMMVAVGTSTAVSNSMGQKNFDRAKSLLGSGIVLLLTIVLPLVAIIFSFTTPVLQLIGVNKDLIGLGTDYLHIVILGITFLGLNMYFSNVLLALGDNKTSVLSNLVGASINVVIDYILVVRHGMGIKGAAVATVVSQICACSYSSIQFIRMLKKQKMNISLKMDKKLFIMIVTLGVSSFVIESEDGVVMGVLNQLLSSSVGAEGVIVLGIVTRIYMFLFITLMGISAAMQPIAAYNSGARDFKRVKKVVKETIKLATGTTVVLWAIMLYKAEFFISVFVKDAAIISQAVVAFRIMISLFPVIGVYYVAIYYYQSMRQARTAIILSILRQLGALVVVALILVKVFKFGALGVWLAYPISDLISGIVAAVLMKNEMKCLDNRILETAAKSS